MRQWKCCTQYVSKFGKLSSGHRTGKGQFSFQFQRKAMPKKMFKLPHNCTHLRLQQYVIRELPDVQAGFWKGRGTRDQIDNIHWIIEKEREFQKNIYFCFIDYANVFVWLTTNCGKFLKRWQPQTTWPASREICVQVRKQVRTGHGTTDWFQIGKGVRQGCILSPCLFNLYAEYITRNSGLEEAKAGIKISRRNINNLRYADDTTLMAES